jgi:hypothetical protein
MGTPSARVPEGAPIPAGTEPAKEAAPPAAPVAGVADPGSVSTAATVKPASAMPATAKAAASAKPAPAPPPTDTASEAALVEFLERQILPYLAASRGDKFRLGDHRFAEDMFRFVKLRVTEAYRLRVEEIQAWCDERRMLDLQVKLQHWLHGWLFIHAPVSFLLLMLTTWHAFVTLFYY